MKHAIRCSALALALVAVAGAAQAQQRSATFGIAAGVSLPMGDFGDAVGTGYHITGLLGFGSKAGSAVGGRAEVSWNSFSGETISGFDIPDTHLLTVTGNITYALSTSSSVHPYLIGGGGLYRFSADGADSESKAGINAGVGAKFQLSGFSTFAEVRFHNVFTDNQATRYVPLSFGIVF